MFGGFKARLHLFGGKNAKGLQSELSPDMTVSGAYRTSRDDFFGYYNSFEQSKTTTTPVQVSQQMRPTKSANDLTKTNNVTPNLRHSSAEVSSDPRGGEQHESRNGVQTTKLTRKQEREQKKLEKQRMSEQKARDKKAAQEQAKQEKLAKEREKTEARQEKAKKDRKPKKNAPKPQAPTPQAATQVAATSGTQYSTNTLESSISKSSGPSPYSDVPQLPEQTRNKSDAKNSSNVTYRKPEDTGSWDMISQHRQQIVRPTTTIGASGKQKQMVMDLNYNFSTQNQDKDNSDA